MTRPINHPKIARRAQQRAQTHIDYHARPVSGGPRSNVSNDQLATIPSFTCPTHGAGPHVLNARAVLSAGTILALLTGGQAAAALVDGGFASPAALAPNRHARRMLQTAATSTTVASLPPSPPPPPAMEPTVSLDVLTRVLTKPPPYSASDMLAFVRGASHMDYVDFEVQFDDVQLEGLVEGPCADEVSRILASSPPFSDADIILFSRAANSAQQEAMVEQNPNFSEWASVANLNWPDGPDLAMPPPPPAPPPPPPPPPIVPVGPPVMLAPTGAINASAFLHVWSGTTPQFSTGSAPLRLVGYNVGLPGNVPCTISTTDFSSVCQTTATNGGNVIRLFAFQTMGGPGNWQNFDAALSTARNYKLKVIWVLGNQWTNCQNVEPGTATDGYHEPAWYDTGYKQIGHDNALSYRDFALATVQRYKNDPTIAMWSLLNEAEAGTVVAGTTCPDEALASRVMAAFVADMASAIRAVDPNHLLTLGTRGQPDNCGLQNDHYLSVQQPMDVLTFHSYAMTYDRVQLLSTQAKSVGKPLIMTEHAQCDSNENQYCEISTDVASLQSRACDMYKVAVGFGGLGVAGELPWYLQAPNGTADAYSINATDPAVARFKKFAAGGSLAVDEMC